MNRRTFLKTGATTAALLLAQPAWCAQPGRAQLTDDEILAQTKDRIGKHRQGDGLLVVSDGKGRPVRGAKVKLEQRHHDFLFGSNFFMFNRCGKPELEDAYRERFAALLNYCTLGFYWAGYEPTPGSPRYEYTDQVVAWTREHGIACKGHPLVWDHPVASPNWLPEDQKEIERLSTTRVREIISRFQGRIDIWDVVNEATHLPDRHNNTKMSFWGASIGPVTYVAEHLKVARAANPKATLLVNDYRTDPPYYKILESLRENGRYLFDTVGIQSHMHDGLWPLDKVWDICDTYSRLGLPIHFTESTIVSGPREGSGEHWGKTTPTDEAKQADQVAKFYTALFAHPSVQAITWWDFSDLGAWQGAPAGWLRRDMSPKPAYNRLMSLIKGAWWTNAEGITDADGEFKTRAFFGTYRLSAELPGGRAIAREVHWERGRPNRFELTA